MRTVLSVDHSDALARLPRAYALALRLQELGADTELIADCLGIAPEAAGPLLEVAGAKLSNTQHLDVRETTDEADHSLREDDEKETTP